MSPALEKLSQITAYARKSLCERMRFDASHEVGAKEGKRDSLLNPPTVLLAIKVWERSIADFIDAAALESYSSLERLLVGAQSRLGAVDNGQKKRALYASQVVGRRA